MITFHTSLTTYTHTHLETPRRGQVNKSCDTQVFLVRRNIPATVFGFSLDASDSLSWHFPSIPACVCVCVCKREIERGRQRDKVCILKHNRSLAVATFCEGSCVCAQTKSTPSEDGWFVGKSIDWVVEGGGAFSLLSSYQLKCSHHSLRQR